MTPGRPRLTARAAIAGPKGWLVLRARDPGPPWYVLPGGGIDENEHIMAALVREIREELGCDIRPGPLLAIQDRTPARLEQGSSRWVHTVSFIFAAEVTDGEPHLAPDMDPDIADIAWIPRRELPDHMVYPLRLRDWMAEHDTGMTWTGQPMLLETR